MNVTGHADIQRDTNHVSELISGGSHVTVNSPDRLSVRRRERFEGLTSEATERRWVGRCVYVGKYA
jgi:hypothetical protein